MPNISSYRSGSSYILCTDEIAGGASKVMMDLFNSSLSARSLLVTGIFIAPKTDVAVTGVVSARFDIFRSSSVGTGGTSNSYGAPSSSAINISPMDSNNASLLDQGITGQFVIPGISARSAPTGGATITQWILPYYAFPEETNAAAILQQSNNVLKDIVNIQPLVLGPNQGLVVKQGSVASVNSFVIIIVFSTSGVPSY